MGMVKVILLVGLMAITTACGGSESRKARHVEQGKEFMAERNYTKARLEFRNALQIDPKDAEARELAGLAAERLGEYEEAAKMYRVAISTDESRVLPRARLGRLFVLAGLSEDALELIAPGLANAPNSADLLSVRALAKVQQGDPVGARKDAEDAVASEPGNVDAVSALAGMLWREGKQPEALDLIRKAIEANPRDVDLHLLLGRLMAETGRLSEAATEFARVVDLEPSSVQHRFQLAQVYLQQRDPAKAIVTLREAVKVAPSEADAKIALLQVIAATGSMDEVEKEIEAFRSAAPRDHDLHLRLADFYRANGLDDKALKAYREIVTNAGRAPQADMARTRIAGLELRSSRLDEAAELVADVLAESPSDAEALAVRADIALQRGDTASAISDLRVAFGNQPDSVPLAAALARAHMQAGQPELAEQVLRSVVQTSPTDVRARFALAQFLTEVGKTAQAGPVLEQLVAEQPNNLLALEGLARVQYAVKDLAGARKSVSAIQSLMPNSARGYVLAGDLARAQSQDEARKLYEQGAAIDPNSPEPVIALVRLDVADGQLARALARVDEGLQRLPGNAILLALRGDLLMGLKRPGDAAASYSAAIDVRPRWAQPYRSLAMARTAAGDDAAAVAVLEKGLAATRNSPWIAMDLALLHARMKKIDEAIAVYEGMLTRNPRDDGVANNLAMLLVTYRSDEKSLERATALAARFANSETAGFLDTYGWVKFKRGDLAEALATLQKAAQKAPRAREIRYHLGMAQLRLGKTEEARKSLELAVAAGADYPGVDDARAALAEM